MLATARWVDREGKPREFFQVVTVENGRIVDIQDCRDERTARRFAERR